MKCPKCSGDNSDDSVYCGLCFEPFGNAKKAEPPRVPKALSESYGTEGENTMDAPRERSSVPKIVAFIAICVIAFGVYKYKSLVFSPHVPDMSYTVVSGETRKLAGTGKPAIIGFWILDCPYAARVMTVLNNIRQDYPESQVDVIGFYVNKIEIQELEKIGFNKNYQIVLSPAQSPPELVWNLDRTFKLRGPGMDIYVVDKKGGIRSIDTSDLNMADSEIYPKIKELVAQALL